MVSHGLIPDQPEMGSGATEVPENRTVIWRWSTKWRIWEEMHFEDIEVSSFQMDRLLVAVGIVDSRSNAQRLIKQGAITWRTADDVMEWTKVKDFREEVQAGWPVYLRVGDGHPRTVMVEERKEGEKPKSVPKTFFSISCVMRPEPEQTHKVWDEAWRPHRGMSVPMLAEFEWEQAFATKAERDKWKLPVASVAELADAQG